MTLEAVTPLSESYAKAMSTGFENRWMDPYQRPRKQSGAHMAGSAYDVHPYVLMNYNDNYESVSTLAHEWGHAMQSYFSNEAQHFINSDYTTFVGDITCPSYESLLIEIALTPD